MGDVLILFLLLKIIPFSCGSNLSLMVFPKGHVPENTGADVNLKYLEKAKKIWFLCATDADCSIAHGYCASPVAVNKNYASAVTAHIGNPDRCLDFQPPSWPDGAFCMNKKCELKNRK